MNLPKPKTMKKMLLFVLLFVAGGVIATAIGQNNTLNLATASVAPYTIAQQPTTYAAPINQLASFKGGNQAFATYLAQSIKYPILLKKMGIEGTVKVRFSLDAAGAVDAIELVESVHPMLDEIAVRAIKDMPNWQPAIRNGRSVDSHIVVPIIFK